MVKVIVKFDGSCLKQKKHIYSQKSCDYLQNLWQFKQSTDLLFGGVKIARRADFDKCIFWIWYWI